jgi:hypothetical protein
MGYHSTNYYNTKMFKGNTDKTGYAWWYDQSRENPDRPSHYPSFIPLPVMRDVLGWDAKESVRLTAVFEMPVLDDDGHIVLGEDGNAVFQEYEIPVKDHKALGRSDWIQNGIPEGEEEGASQILSIVSTEYGVHNAKDVFFGNVEILVGGEENMGIESFGELKWGRRLFASFSLPDHVVNPDSGLEFRPILTVVTSYDRTLATKYVRTFGIPVCDNTLNWELTRAGEKDGQFTLKHSKNSAARLGDAKVALGLLTEQVDDMQRFTSELMSVEVPEDIFVKWLDKMVPIPEVKRSRATVKSVQGEDVEIEKISAHAQTIALKKRDQLVEMWDIDPRVTGPIDSGRPWKNTKLGLLQLWNTYNQREASFKGAKAFGGDKDSARAQMNMDKTINGTFATEDAKALKALDIVFKEEAEKVAVAVPAGAPTSDPEKKVPAKRTSRSKTQNN